MENQVISNQPTSKQEVKSPSKFKLLRYVIIEIISILFWCYVFITLFIYDVDRFIINKVSHKLAFVLDYKFFFFVGILALIWLFKKNLNIFISLLYILFYPLIIITWKLPRFVWKIKSWNFALAIVSAFVSFFRSIKFYFISIAFLLILSIFIFSVNNKLFILVSLITLPILLSLIYIHRFISLFKPSALYSAYSKIVSRILSFTRKNFKQSAQFKDQNISELTVDQLNLWGGPVQLLVVANRGTYFLSSKLRDYQKSKYNVVFYVFNFFLLFLLTVLVFATTSYGLIKFRPESFILTSGQSFFLFIYYATNALFSNGIREIIPDSTLSRFLFMLELLYSFGLAGMFLTLIFSVRTDKDIEEIDVAIAEINEQGEAMEKFIEMEYQLSVEEAITHLARAKAALITVIYFLSTDSALKITEDEKIESLNDI